MPERWSKLLLLGYPPGFWLAVIAVALAQAATQRVTLRAALASILISAVLAGVFTQAIVDHWELDPSTGVVAGVGGAITALGQTVIRVIGSINSFKDLSSAATELVRAWRGIK